MSIFIPEWVLLIPVIYIGMGVLMWPVLMVRVHRAMRHNHGWKWQRAITGWNISILRVVIWNIITIIAWPWAMREV